MNPEPSVSRPRPHGLRLSHAQTQRGAARAPGAGVAGRA